MNITQSTIEESIFTRVGRILQREIALDPTLADRIEESYRKKAPEISRHEKFYFLGEHDIASCGGCGYGLRDGEVLVLEENPKIEAQYFDFEGDEIIVPLGQYSFLPGPIYAMRRKF